MREFKQIMLVAITASVTSCLWIPENAKLFQKLHEAQEERDVAILKLMECNGVIQRINNDSTFYINK